MKRQIKLWSREMMMGYRYAVMNRKKQNAIFAKNAMLRQKIVGCLVSLITLAIWIWFTAYDVKLIWWGLMMFPVIVWGCYLMLTDKRVFADLEKMIREEYE